MSIYLAKKELINILEKSSLDFKIPISKKKKLVVYNKKILLEYKDYNEEDLERIIKKYKKAIIDFEFWNYNYCSYNNLDSVISENIINDMDTIVGSLKDFSVGTITILIIIHEILLKIYKIKSNKVFIQYLQEIKVSRKIIKNFMLNMKYQLPLTDNYLTLILEVFDKETIFDFLFKKCCNFTLGEFEKIMEYFELSDIHLVSYYIFTSFKDKSKQLKYLDKCLVLFEDKIDFSENVIFKKKNNNPHVGYYLLTMKLNTKLEPLYYCVVKKYLDKYGSLNIIIEDNEDENKIIQIRKQEILNYFDKY